MNRLSYRSRWTLVFCAILAPLIGFSSLGAQLERRLYDETSRLFRGGHESTSLLVVGIDDNTFDLMAEEEDGLKWPYPRATHARVVRHLTEAGAKAVIFDVIFDTPSGFGEHDDREFAQAVSSIPVYLSGIEDEHTLTRPLDRFVAAGAKPVNAALPLDPDGAIRRMPGADSLPASIGEGLLYLAGIRKQPRPPALVSPSAALGSAETVPGYIRYSGIIPQISYYEVFNPALFPKRKELIKDRIVFIGSTPSASITPQDRADLYLVGTDGMYVPGVMIHAQAVRSALDGRSLSLLPAPIYTLLFLLWLASLGAVLLRGEDLRSLVFRFLGALFVLGAGSIGAHAGGLIVPAVPLFLVLAFDAVALITLRYLQERDEKLIVRTQLFSYLPEKVAQWVLRQPRGLAGAADRTEISVLFCDLADFTSISETLEPEILLPLIQEHLDQMTETIFAHGGTVDKFIGDGVMAFWGAPEPQSNHTELAFDGAHGMLKRFDEANSDRRSRGLPDLKMRVGLHTGEAVVGNVGSKLLIHYTAMGDVVNTASRLEGLNKLFGTRLLISEECRAGLTDEQKLALTFLGRVAVKGRATPTPLYAVIDGAKSETRESFERYLSLLDQEPEKARAALVELVRADPDFLPALFHRRMWEAEPIARDSENRAYWKVSEK